MLKVNRNLYILTMVNIFKLKLTNLQQEILRVLFKKMGIKLNQRQIAKALNASQAAVMKALPSLKKIGFVKLEKDKETKRWSVELTTSNDKIMQKKRVDNLE